MPLDLDLILRLLPSAVAAGMGLVTSLSIACSPSARLQQLLDAANQEVRAQGFSNIVGSFFSGSLSAGSSICSA